MHHLPSVVGVVVLTLVAVTATVATNVVVYTIIRDTQHKKRNKHTHMDA